MSWNSELNVFKKIWFVREISNKLPNGLFGINVYKTIESCWISLLTILQWTNITCVVSRCGTFSPLLSLVILFSLVQVLRVQDCIQFNFKCNSIFYFIYIYCYWCIISVLSMLSKYNQNNFKYLIQDMIHLVIQIYHSMLELIFWVYCYCMSFLCFSMCNK